MKKVFNKIKDNRIPIICGLIPFIIFIILYFAYYPGIITFDGNNQWQQVQSGIITNAHPFFSTYFMYLLSKIWNSTNIIIIFQILVYSVIWGYFCKLLKENNKKNLILIIGTIIISSLPIIAIYSITLWKDVLYSYYLFLVAVLFYKEIIGKSNFFDYILIGFLLSMVFSYRHNGIIVAILLLIIYMIYLIKKKTNYKKIISFCLTFVAIILLISIPKNHYLSLSNKQTKNEVKLSTIDSYMLWQTGAYIKSNSIKSDDDLKFLNNIIPIKTWKKIYNPYIINGTSNCKEFDKKFLSKNIEKFRKIYFKNIKENPLILMEHYVKSDSMLLSPVMLKKGYLYIFDFSEWVPCGFDSKTNSKLPFVKKIYNYSLNISIRKPLDVLYRPAIWLYLGIIITFILSKKVYGKKIWMFIMPMLCNTLSLLPINLAQDLRYVYINFLVTFALLMILIINYDKIKKKGRIR